MEQLVVGGMLWEKTPTNILKEKWSSDNHKFDIFKDKRGKFRLVAFDHDPSDQFPEAEFWMREFPTLEAAATQAEMM